jgi:protein SCO1/2
MRHRSNIPAALAVVVALALAVGAAGMTQAETRLSLDRSFALVDANGKAVTGADFPGRWLLIYFGYTHCADQCPTALSTMVEAMDQIGPAAQYIQPLFITVDPKRDRGPMLAAFVASFDKRLIGLTGTPKQVADTATLFGIEYTKVLAGSDDDVIDHSTKLSLVAPDRHDAVSFAFAEPYLVAAKLIDELSHAGVRLDRVNNLRAYR